MLRLSTIFFLIIVSTACSNPEGKKILIQSPGDSLFIPKDSTTFYFPSKPKPSYEDSSYNVMGLDTFENKWFSHQLYALREPVLFDYPKQIDVYRFTWLRTFHHPIAIRLEKYDDSIFINVKMCDRNGGFTPGKLVLNKTISLSKNSWEKFLSKFDKLNFWKSLPDTEDHSGTDGAEWILEAKKNYTYHFSRRWSPEKNDFADCCLYLVSLAGFSQKELPAKDIY